MDLRKNLLKNKAVATASVTCGWAGAVMQKPLTEYMCDGLTNGPMDRQTDQQTDQLMERPTE